MRSAWDEIIQRLIKLTVGLNDEAPKQPDNLLDILHDTEVLADILEKSEPSVVLHDIQMVFEEQPSNFMDIELVLISTLETLRHRSRITGAIVVMRSLGVLARCLTRISDENGDQLSRAQKIMADLPETVEKIAGLGIEQNESIQTQWERQLREAKKCNPSLLDLVAVPLDDVEDERVLHADEA